MVSVMFAEWARGDAGPFPAPEKCTGAAVVICPGGGYSILALEHEGTRVAEWFAALGVTGIVLKYRVPSGQRGEKNVPPLQDAQRAMSLIRRRAGEWGIDPDRIGLLGFSAGGHLAAATAANFARRTYSRIDAVDDVSSRPDFLILVYPAYLLADGSSCELDATVAVGAESCPTFLLHAGDDHIAPEGSIAYCLALRSAGIPAELHIYESGGHGFGLAQREHRIGTTWQDRLAGWLGDRGLGG